jgi:hypothetical protein
VWGGTPRHGRGRRPPRDDAVIRVYNEAGDT